MEKGAVSETIEKLLVVQERDQRIFRAQKELDDIPGMRAELETAASERSGLLEKAKERLKSVRAEVHKIEVEIESHRQQISKLRDQQMQIKSNDEYKALNAEIGHVEKKIRGLEDRALELMEQIEQAESDVAKAQADVAADQSRLKQELDVLEQRHKAVSSDMEQLRAERESLVEGIDKTWLSRYNMIMENKRDVALAMLEGEGTCAGCHMNLPPQIIHDVKAEASMVSCSFCGRLLYWAG